jgi:hypothetical protein
MTTFVTCVNCNSKWKCECLPVYVRLWSWTVLGVYRYSRPGTMSFDARKLRLILPDPKITVASSVHSTARC